VPKFNANSVIALESSGTTMGSVVKIKEGSGLSFATSGGILTITASGGGGANTLDGSYDQGGSGAGRTITADSGAVTITTPDGANNIALSVAQNNGTNNPIAMEVINVGTGDSFKVTQGGNEMFTIASGEIVVNEASAANFDFRVESNANANAFKVDGQSELVQMGVTATIGATHTAGTAGSSLIVGTQCTLDDDADNCLAVGYLVQMDANDSLGVGKSVNVPGGTSDGSGGTDAPRYGDDSNPVIAMAVASNTTRPSVNTVILDAGTTQTLLGDAGGEPLIGAAGAPSAGSGNVYIEGMVICGAADYA